MSLSTLETAAARTRPPAFSPVKLIEARQRRGWSKDRLAEAIGRDLRTIQRYESGAVVPPVAVVCALSVSLLIPLGDLFE